MTVIKINAITVPADAGDELAHRFAARAGAVDGQPGFEGFELLKPVDGRTQWLVVTRWADEESFEAWRTSPAFGHGHGRPAGSGAGPVAGEATEHGTRPAGGEVAPGSLDDGVDPADAPPVAGEATGHGTHPAEPPAGHRPAHGGGPGAGRPPVGIAAELWSYEVAVVSTSARG